MKHNSGTTFISQRKQLSQAVRMALVAGLMIGTAQAQTAGSLAAESLNGGNGFLFNSAYDDNGRSVAMIGDINGDGIDDFAIGAPEARDGDGAVSVVFGRTTGFPANISASDLDGTNGFVAEDGPGGYLGQSIAGIGDVNGDGIDDLALGMYGAVLVLYGRSDGFPAHLDLRSDDFDNGRGFVIFSGSYGSHGLGSHLAAAGDVNGDGHPDFVIAAQDASTGTNNYNGAAYVVFGHDSTDPFDSDPYVEDMLSAGKAFQVDGPARNYLSYGIRVSGIGDFNGDGFDDIAIGMQEDYFDYSDDNGSAFVVFGGSSLPGTTLAMDSLDTPSTAGFHIYGNTNYSHLGISVSGAGDVNGDGYPDLLVGASGAKDANDTFTGAAYVVFGADSGFDVGAQAIDSFADGDKGFKLIGASYSYAGTSVSGLGDINGDGIDDFAVLAPNASYGGRAYVVLGHDTDTAWPAEQSLDLATVHRGGRFEGGYAGYFSDDDSMIAGGGDINGDGRNDFLIGAETSNLAMAVFGNPPPMADTGPALLNATIEDVGNPLGTSLATALLPYYLDYDPLAGAAITVDAPVSADGVWQYKLRFGHPWTDMPSGLGVGSALLLSPDSLLRFVPAPDFSGNAPPISLRMWDGQGDYDFGAGQDIASRIGWEASGFGGFADDQNLLQVTAPVLPVNDAPSFTASNPPVAGNYSGAVSVPGWASFTAGPANESAQTPTYLVSAVSNPGLFSSLPVIDADGTLYFAPNPGSSGTSSFSVRVRDSGGTANGGVDLSPIQTFTITVLDTGGGGSGENDVIFCSGFDGLSCPLGSNG